MMIIEPRNQYFKQRSLFWEKKDWL